MKGYLFLTALTVLSAGSFFVTVSPTLAESTHRMGTASTSSDGHTNNAKTDTSTYRGSESYRHDGSRTIDSRTAPAPSGSDGHSNNMRNCDEGCNDGRAMPREDIYRNNFDAGAVPVGSDGNTFIPRSH